MTTPDEKRLRSAAGKPRLIAQPLPPSVRRTPRNLQEFSTLYRLISDPIDHDSRSERLLWGNILVAGLGSQPRFFALYREGANFCKSISPSSNSRKHHPFTPTKKLVRSTNAQSSLPEPAFAEIFTTLTRYDLFRNHIKIQSLNPLRKKTDFREKFNFHINFSLRALRARAAKRKNYDQFWYVMNPLLSRPNVDFPDVSTCHDPFRHTPIHVPNRSGSPFSSCNSPTRPIRPAIAERGSLTRSIASTEFTFRGFSRASRSATSYPPSMLRRVCTFAAFLCLGTLRESFPASSQSWPVYGGNFEGTKYSALSQINRENVQRLKPAWIYRCDDMRERPASTIECNPIIIARKMFLTSPGLKLIALDAASGKELWRFDPWDGAPGRGINRGVAYWSSGNDERIFFSAAQHLYAIDAKTGKPIPTFGASGRIDLRDGLDRDVYFLSVTANSPGVVYKDLIIMGSVVGEGPSPAAPGHIRAFDVRTGKRRWIFHTIPHPGEFGYETWSTNSWKTVGGANSWSGLTLDVERGIVFAGTGSPSYDHYGGNRIGQNLFANSVLALNANTGERVWHFQTVHHDLWDYDLPCPPVLVQAKHEGKVIDAVAQVGKIGHLFLFDRVSGKPLFPIEERPVPKSEIPGEVSWPTQPFPVKPPPYAMQRFTTNEVTDLNQAARDFVLEKLKGMVTGDIFIPPGLKPSVVLPQFNGGAEWGGPAFDPESRLLFVNASNEAEWTSMISSKPREEMTISELGAMIYGTICSSCHGFEDANNPNAPAFATLKGVKDRLTKPQVHELLETGRNQMPSFATLSDIEKRAVISFLFDEKQTEKILARELQLSWAEEIPYVNTGHHDFRDPGGYPVNKRPWGTLSAIDLDNGEIRWQVPLGTYPALEKKGEPPTGTFNIGGPLVTAGGLVFIGAAMDERFHAFDKETGKLVWEFQMEAGGYATPSTFSVDGKQYIVIAAGGGGKPGTKAGNAYYCFSLAD